MTTEAEALLNPIVTSVTTFLDANNKPTAAKVGKGFPVESIQKTVTQTDRSGTITTGGQSQILFPANSNGRNYWIKNTSTGSLFINRFGTTATTSDFELKAGEYFETPVFERTTNAIGIIGATTGQAFQAGECE